MRELFDLQCDLFEEHQIVMTIFSYKDEKNKTMFRAYFKDLNNGYVFNPTEIKREDPTYPLKTTSVKYIGIFDSYKGALSWLVGEAWNYTILKK